MNRFPVCAVYGFFRGRLFSGNGRQTPEARGFEGVGQAPPGVSGQAAAEDAQRLRGIGPGGVRSGEAAFGLRDSGVVRRQTGAVLRQRLLKKWAGGLGRIEQGEAQKHAGVGEAGVALGVGGFEPLDGAPKDLHTLGAAVEAQQ